MTIAPTASPADVLRARLQRRPVAELPELCHLLHASGRTVFRVLQRIGYLSSYSHAGRYYTLKDIPTFDAYGLWFYQDVGFSVEGTLRATVEHLVDNARAGYLHEELQPLLRLRVYDTLRSLVQAGRIARERLDARYVYVSAVTDRARVQLAFAAHEN